ncbi:MAG TPA: AAA family ATPase [Chthonomonadaceae bacterium]|nr:AAA family ATPase [Chthonomonadaceae bacterium]
MTRSAPEPGGRQLEQAAVLLQAWMEGAASDQDALAILAAARTQAPDANGRLDEMLLRELRRARQGLIESGEMIEEAQKILDQYGASPWIPARFLYTEPTRLGDMAVVVNGGGQRVVAVGRDADITGLKTGQWIYLNAEQSVLAAVAGGERPQTGEMAAFERYTGDGRIVLKSGNDEQILVAAAAALDDTALRPGDTVRWDRPARLCLEKMSDGERNPYLLEQVEDIPLDRIGGQHDNLDRLRDALVDSLLYPELAERYRLPCSHSLLLHGPPGCGKTAMTRAVFSEIQRRAGMPVYLAVVKASQWESKWVGQTQANIASLFASLRTAASEGAIAALFVDEIEAVGRIRGSVSGHHSDKALSALLNEMNGFRELKNVSIVAACNRKDLLDAALLSRFGAEISVRRPDRRGAQEIFGVHLEPEIPYQGEGGAEAVRAEMIDRAVSSLFAPNADGELCVLKLRDARTRTVSARELVSGRLIQQIALAAKDRARRRHKATGTAGLCAADMDEALVEARERLATTLTPHNAHNHLESLAEDEVVLGVEPIRRRVTRAHRFLVAVGG